MSSGTSGGWRSSDRHSRLPDDWQQRRNDTALAAGGRCECTGWCKRHSGRCVEPGSQADHAGAKDDHDDLQWLCASCHDVKTQTEAARGRAWRYARFDNSEPHPGLQPRKEPR